LHPQTEQESILRTLLLCGEDLELQLVVLYRLLKATTKKRSSTLFRKKVHPKQNPGYAYVFIYLLYNRIQGTPKLKIKIKLNRVQRELTYSKLTKKPREVPRVTVTLSVNVRIVL